MNQEIASGACVKDAEMADRTPVTSRGRKLNRRIVAGCAG
jgi:hypothetical protein